MSKASTIRKRALEYARKQNWDAAIREYQRLAEIDQSNPNLYNELGDIYLKIGNKGEAYESFARAVDAYAKVSLYNNAVAVCKKVLRIIPTRYEVLAKLGVIRKKQGLGREAESYCISYLERVSQDGSLDPAKLAGMSEEIVEALGDSAVVLDRLAACLTGAGLDDEAGKVLAGLDELYQREGVTEARDDVRRRLEALGMGHLVAEAAPSAPPEAREGPVMTEENLWTDSLSEGERISVQSEREESGAAETMGDPEAGEAESVYDWNDVQLGDAATSAAAGAGEDDDAPAGGHVAVEAEEPPAEESNAADAAPAAPEPEDNDAADEDPVKVSAVMVGEGGDTGAGTGDDYRSHYDLGMAYLEMNLFEEAVREYQLAARSPEFHTKSLEMIGLCFLRQNKPQLAIRQLTKGLNQIDDSDAGALGIRYNLGLAYEMAGDIDKARVQFEDVYVVDVSFRDVAEKIAKYAKA